MTTEVRLSREMRLLDITMIGVGAMIGAGIFVLTGIAAGVAGPALMVVFLLNGLVALLTAAAYAELGSAVRRIRCRPPGCLARSRSCAGRTPGGCCSPRSGPTSSCSSVHRAQGPSRLFLGRPCPGLVTERSRGPVVIVRGVEPRYTRFQQFFG